MHTSLIDAITLNRQNVEIYTRAYHPCRLLPHRIEDHAFQTPHKLCVPSGSVRFPPEACVLLIQRVMAPHQYLNQCWQIISELFGIHLSLAIGRKLSILVYSLISQGLITWTHDKALQKKRYALFIVGILEKTNQVIMGLNCATSPETRQILGIW